MGKLNELKITMLGPSGVGKTTLLTSMYEQFESTSLEANIQLIPDPETKGILEQYLHDLKSLAKEFRADERKKKGIQGTGAIAGPESLPSYIFDLGGKEQKLSLRLNFRDYPGGYILSSQVDERQFVKNLLRECTAVILAIDTPAIMELDGRWHEARNKPDEITKLFKTAYQKLNEPKLVILAPVKCETYVQNEESARKLVERIKIKYSPLLEFLGELSRRDNITVVTTPIQTVGCVVFLKIEVEHYNKPYFYFRKKSTNAQYSPQDGDQLLKYLLRFLFKRHNQQLLVERSPILRMVRHILNQNTEFETAVELLAKGCKTTGGFAVLQNPELLNI